MSSSTWPPSVRKFAAGREGRGNVERFARGRREPYVKQIRESEDGAKNQKAGCITEKRSGFREDFVGGCDEISEPGSVHL